MSSILQNFHYDIFISYRHNDNRSGWVTEFIEHLQEELAATIKEPLTIYFDKNPHDGLLETHNVDKSLEGKLKCLIFIPIISQTYCDPKSFAWQHEFVAFNKLAQEDELGRDIKLSNGNVASRILPIKIHDLDASDEAILEKEIAGVLRAIEFIYKEPGVNRPLGISDNKNDNENKTDYRNQVNKMANAVKEIIGTLSPRKRTFANKLEEKIVHPTKRTRKLGAIMAAAVLILAFAMYFLYPIILTPDQHEKSIAILAFEDQSPDGSQEWLGDGMAEEILNVLAKVKGLKVTGRTSSFSFKNKDVTIQEIGEILNVETILEGSVSKIGNQLRITAQLIDVRNDQHIWSEKYSRDAEDIFSIIDEVAQNISKSLLSELSLEDLNRIEVNQQVNPEAYEYYLKGVNIHWDKFIIERENVLYLQQSAAMFLNAISIDSTYSNAYAGLADLYDTRAYIEPEYDMKRDSVINRGFRFKPNSAYLLAIKGWSLIQDGSEILIDSGFQYFKMAYQLDSSNTIIKSLLAEAYWKVGLYDNMLKLDYDILSRDPLNMYIKHRAAIGLLSNGDVMGAKNKFSETLKIEPNNQMALRNLFLIAVQEKNKERAQQIYDKLEFSSSRVKENESDKAMLLAMDGKEQEALAISKHFLIYAILNMKEEGIQQLEENIRLQGFLNNLSYITLKNSKFYDFVREEPTFKEILSRAKKVHDERVAKFAHLIDN